LVLVLRSDHELGIPLSAVILRLLPATLAATGATAELDPVVVKVGDMLGFFQKQQLQRFPMAAADNGRPRRPVFFHCET